MSAHTPGPWSVRSYGGGQYVQHWFVSGPSLHTDTSNKEKLPDMYLIAAAPDLLDGLMQANSQLEMAADAIENGRYDEALLHCRAMSLRRFSPIAKATGEKA